MRLPYSPTRRHPRLDELSVPVTVAIDGPSGSGKSSVSRAVATRLGAGYLDTGAMYRALTWWCRHTEVDLGDADAIIAAALGLPLEIGDDPQAPTVAVDGTDVDAVALAILAILGDRAAAAEMGRAGRRYVVENWQWSQMAARLRQLL